jgi:hypothetical protein
MYSWNSMRKQPTGCCGASSRSGADVAGAKAALGVEYPQDGLLRDEDYGRSPFAFWPKGRAQLAWF